MARIIADRGRQRTLDGHEFIFEMDCGCDIRVPERAWMSGTRSSGVDLRGRLERVADAHDCDVVVHHAPEWHRREVQARRRAEIRYMGMRVESSPDFPAWATTIFANDWRRPALPTRAGQPPSLESPEQTVRRAAELRGLQITSLVVDEAVPASVGFKLEAPKAKEPDRPKDRFELIELD